MRHYRLTTLLFFVPFMAASGIDRIQGTGWDRLWGTGEIALAVCVLAGAGQEIRKGLIRRREAKAAGHGG